MTKKLKASELDNLAQDLAKDLATQAEFSSRFERVMGKEYRGDLDKFRVKQFVRGKVGRENQPMVYGKVLEALKDIGIRVHSKRKKAREPLKVGDEVLYSEDSAGKVWAKITRINEEEGWADLSMEVDGHPYKFSKAPLDVIREVRKEEPRRKKAQPEGFQYEGDQVRSPEAPPEFVEPAPSPAEGYAWAYELIEKHTPIPEHVSMLKGTGGPGYIAEFSVPINLSQIPDRLDLKVNEIIAEFKDELLDRVWTWLPLTRPVIQEIYPPVPEEPVPSEKGEIEMWLLAGFKDDPRTPAFVPEGTPPSAEDRRNESALQIGGAIKILEEEIKKFLDFANSERFWIGKFQEQFPEGLVNKLYPVEEEFSEESRSEEEERVEASKKTTVLFSKGEEVEVIAPGDPKLGERGEITEIDPTHDLAVVSLEGWGPTEFYFKEIEKVSSKRKKTAQSRYQEVEDQQVIDKNSSYYGQIGEVVEIAPGVMSLEFLDGSRETFENEQLKDVEFAESEYESGEEIIKEESMNYAGRVSDLVETIFANNDNVMLGPAPDAAIIETYLTKKFGLVRMDPKFVEDVLMEYEAKWQGLREEVESPEVGGIEAKKKSADKWKGLPEGWTEKSLKSFYDSVGGSTSKCIGKLKGHSEIEDPGAFCASLKDRVKGTKWRHEKKGRKLSEFKIGDKIELTRQIGAVSKGMDGEITQVLDPRTAEEGKYQISTEAGYSVVVPGSALRLRAARRIDKLEVGHFLKDNKGQEFMVRSEFGLESGERIVKIAKMQPSPEEGIEILLLKEPEETSYYKLNKDGGYILCAEEELEEAQEVDSKVGVTESSGKLGDYVFDSHPPVWEIEMNPDTQQMILLRREV